MRFKVNTYSPSIEESEDVASLPDELVTNNDDDNIIEIVDGSLVEGDDIVTDVADAEHDRNLLETIASTMSDKLENNQGISPTTATIIEHTLESMYKRYGVEGIHAPKFVSIENFSNSRKSVIATKIALESIMDMIQSVGVFIINRVKWFGKWLKKAWSNFQSLVYETSDALNSLRQELSRYNEVRDTGTMTQIKWFKDHFYSDNYEPQWREVQASLMNVIKATDLEIKAMMQIKDFFKNNNKLIEIFADTDPFGLRKFNPYLGTGKFIQRDLFSILPENGNKAQGFIVPNYTEFFTFLNDACKLVSKPAIMQLDRVYTELNRLIEFVTDYKTQQQIVIDPGTNLPVTQTVEVPVVKLEFRQAIDMARTNIELFWDLRLNAAKSALKISRYIMNRFVL